MESALAGFFNVARALMPGAGVEASRNVPEPAYFAASTAFAVRTSATFFWIS